MTVWARSAVCAVAATLAFASAAHALAPAGTAYPFQAPGLTSAVDLSQTIALPAASYGPPAIDRLAVSNVATSISLITGLDLELGYKVDLSGRVDLFDATNAHAFDRLFLSSASASMPYTSLANGGDLYGVAAAVADDLHINLGVADLNGASSYAPDAYTALARLGGNPAPYNPRTANSLLAGVSWNLTQWGNLGLTATQTQERDGILGQPAPGSAASTTALGVAARVHFGDGWVTTATYSEGITQLDLRPGLNITTGTGDTLRTRSYSLAIAKNGLFGDDSLGLAVSSPALGGDGDFVTLTGAGGGQRFFSRSNLLAGTTPETDIEVGYVTTFLDGSVALQANASYQMNFAGQTGTNAVSLLSRARIKF
jgi:hypothetical protein